MNMNEEDYKEIISILTDTLSVAMDCISNLVTENSIIARNTMAMEGLTKIQHGMRSALKQ